MNWKAIRIIFSFLGAYPYLLRPTVSLQVRYLLKEKLPFHAEPTFILKISSLFPKPLDWARIWPGPEQGRTNMIHQVL